MRRARRSLVPFVIGGILVVSGGYAFAQFGQDPFGGFGGFGGLRGEQGDPPELPPPHFPDSDFTACHLLYTSVRRESNGAGWRTDYPWGERHLQIRLSEITKTRVSLLRPGTPHSWLVRLTDRALFNCT